jgi:all-trans-retinol 13,14-reductase
MLRTERSAGIWANLGFVAWIVYGYFARTSQWMNGALAGLTITAVILGMEYRRQSVKTMDCTSIAYFATVTLVVLADGTSLIQHYHLPFVWGIFALVAWITIFSGSPFTVEYAREQSPPEVWHHPLFHRMNVQMTIVWAMIFTVGAVLGTLSLYVGHVFALGFAVPMTGMGVGIAFSRFYPRRFAGIFAAESIATGRVADNSPSTKLVSQS